MRFALVLLTLWITLPPAVCQALCEAEAAEASPPPCHAAADAASMPMPAPAEPADDLAGCAHCDDDPQATLLQKQAPTDPVAWAALAVPVLEATRTIDTRHEARFREPPRRAGPFAQANPPLLT